MIDAKDLIVQHPSLYHNQIAGYPFSEALEDRFMVQSRFGDTIRLSQRSESQSQILLPRAVCAMGHDAMVDGYPIEVMSNLVPRSKAQAGVIDATTDFLKEGKSGVVEASTGFGKTACAMSIIANVGRKTLVVVTKDDIEKQWFQACKQFLGLGDYGIGRVRQDVVRVKGCYVVIAMIHTLVIPGRFPKEHLDDFGLVIFDEVHRVPADSFQVAASMFPARCRLGLSATPERADGKEIVVRAHIGPKRVRAALLPMIPKVLRFRTNWKVPVGYFYNPAAKKHTVCKMPHKAGKAGHVLTHMATDQARNHKLAAILATCYGKGRKTVFFSDRIAHLEEIKTIIKAKGIPAKDIGWYVGGNTKKEKHQRDQDKVKPTILATFAMMGEGTDIPWLDCAVLGMPRADVKQIVGRVLREYPDKKQPVVFDPLDMDSPVFARYDQRRLKWFQEIGAEVKNVKL